MNPTTDAARAEHVITTMTARMATLTRTLSTWMQEQEHTLAEVEQHVVRLLKELGGALVAELCALAAAPQPCPTISCACGHVATYQRTRKAQVTTLLGPITIWRASYLCARCRVGQHPLDAQLQYCAGSRSQALDELLALLGATQDSFVQAAQVIERLTLVHVAAKSVRAATEQLGAVLCAQHAQAQDAPAPCPPVHAPATAAPDPLYITMDGVLAHLHARGWSEIKAGGCYRTSRRVDRRHPERQEIRAHSMSYVAARETAQRFGWRLWREAVRRGLYTSKDVVVLGDGAHWIWHIAAQHFPRATQIVDWYHATEYIWNAARAIWGEDERARSAWAHAQLDELWEGKVAAVLVELETWREKGTAVEAALSYSTEHQTRMDYASYRARGLHIGSGSAESACKQLVTARIKQAGMIWSADGAEAVAVVRAWLKSDRWDEAIALRGVRKRSYRRTQEAAAPEESVGNDQAGAQQASEASEPQAHGKRHVLRADVLAQVQAELAEGRGKNVWGKARRVGRQREQAAQPEQSRPSRAA